MWLLNCRSKEVSGMFDGRTTVFKPYEKKMIYDNVEGNHLLAKLTAYGIVEMKDARLEHDPLFLAADGGVNPVFKELFTEGATNIRHTLDFVVGQFKQMNMDREASKMARELPSKTVIEAVKELEVIDNFLRSVNAADYELVEKYLNNSENQATKTKIEEAEQTVEQSTGTSKIKGKGSYASNGKGGHKKVAAR